MLYSKGDLIRCTRDNDIGVVLDFDPEELCFTVFWASVGFSVDEEGDPKRWNFPNLFVKLSHEKKANDI
jgi:hypothetical protein